MVKLLSLLVLASAATALSLERSTHSIGTQKHSIAGKTSMRKTARARALHSAPTFLSSEDADASESAEVVAAAVVAAPVSFVDKIWNEQTKLSAYLAVWYLGNIYYNIYNKKACIALGKNAHGASNLHWMLSAVQLLVGVLFVVPLWLTGLRTVRNGYGYGYGYGYKFNRCNIWHRKGGFNS
jgi:hypothetical protein